jgi:predicted DNA-binding protein (MmcQ/YjbR family)
MTTGRKPSSTTKWRRLREEALGLPGAWEDFPWTEVVVKVNKKIFVFLGRPDALEQRVTVKLIDARDHALSVEGAVAAGYGLGKSGWVTLPITSVDDELLGEWLEESYRHVAPKRLLAELDRS